jgi:beta-phosphoglucomutase-like phosphatase (HAD superfamily)
MLAFLLAAAMTGNLQAETTAISSTPDHEAHLEEARRLGVDPLDLAASKKRSGQWTMQQYIAFSKFNRASQEAEAKEREIRIAKKEAESLEATKRIVTAMKSLDAQGRMSPKAVADLNWLFNNGSEEEKELIRRELGKYLKP